LESFGCTVETDDFSARTPAGRIAMKNILVKIPGDKRGVILLGTHYDTLKKKTTLSARMMRARHWNNAGIGAAALREAR